jgi:WD40 repeat protein
MNCWRQPALITFRPHTASVTALAISADGRALASVSHDRWVKVWEVSGFASQALRWEAKASAQGLNHCQFSPDGRELYTGSDGRVRVWAGADGKLLREHEPAAVEDLSPIFAFALSRTGDEVAWCGSTWHLPHQIAVARTNTLDVARRLDAHGAEVMILAAYDGGFCSGSVDRTMKFWDWQSETCHATIQARGIVRALAVSPDGKRVAVAGPHGVATITAYDRAGHGVARGPTRFRGHRRRIECIEFSPDSTRLASVALDGTLRLWHAASGECLRTFALGLGGLHWVTFAPDGLTLAFSSLGGDIGLLDLDG